MADTAFQVQYRQEFVRGFETRQSLLRDTVTTEAMVKGNQATFLVADSGGATAVTRGSNGRIPGRPDNLTQYTATLQEWHDVPEKTGFNLFASQGDGKRIMQETSMAVINRKIDSDIITELNTGTNDSGTATTASVRMAIYGITVLGNNKVPMDGNIFGVISPAFLGYLMQTKEFASADYVTRKPMEGNDMAWKDQPGFYNWMGVKWLVHSELPGAGTSAEKCFLYHRSAIGHAAPTDLIQTYADYDRREDFSYCRVTAYMGAKLLQNSGVFVFNHDGSAFAAQ